MANANIHQIPESVEVLISPRNQDILLKLARSYPSYAILDVKAIVQEAIDEKCQAILKDLNAPKPAPRF